MDRFSFHLIASIFRKSVEKIQVSLKSDRNKNSSYALMAMSITAPVPPTVTTMRYGGLLSKDRAAEA
jgi:hypothetical protein